MMHAHNTGIAYKSEWDCFSYSLELQFGMSFLFCACTLEQPHCFASIREQSSTVTATPVRAPLPPHLLERDRTSSQHSAKSVFTCMLPPTHKMREWKERKKELDKKTLVNTSLFLESLMLLCWAASLWRFAIYWAINVNFLCEFY